MQPYNYNVQQIDPFGSALKGMQRGEAYNAAQENKEASKARVAQTIQMNNELAELSRDYNPHKVRAFVFKHPQFSSQFKSYLDGLTAEQKDNERKRIQRLNVMSIMNPKKAVEEIQIMSDNAEDEPTKRYYSVLAEGAKLNPNGLKVGTQAMLSAVLTPDEYSDYTNKIAQAGKYKKETSLLEREMKNKEAETLIERDKANANLINANTAKDRLAFDKDVEENKNRLIAITPKQLSTVDQKHYVTLKDSYKESNDTENEISKISTEGLGINWKGGILNKSFVKLKELLGEGGIERVKIGRKTVTRSKRNPKVISYLKSMRALAIKEAQKLRSSGSGSQSDKEFNEYMSTVPDLNAGSQQWGIWLTNLGERMNRRKNYNLLNMKWADKYGNYRGATGNDEIFKGLPPTKVGELPEEYAKRVGYLGSVYYITENGKRLKFESNEQMKRFLDGRKK